MKLKKISLRSDAEKLSDKEMKSIVGGGPGVGIGGNTCGLHRVYEDPYRPGTCDGLCPTVIVGTGPHFFVTNQVCKVSDTYLGVPISCGCY